MGITVPRAEPESRQGGTYGEGCQRFLREAVGEGDGHRGQEGHLPPPFRKGQENPRWMEAFPTPLGVFLSLRLSQAISHITNQFEDPLQQLAK